MLILGSIKKTYQPVPLVSANLKALLHMDGSNLSTTFIDNSPSPRTYNNINGTAYISSNFSKFGSTSLFVDGNINSHIRPFDSNRFNLTNLDFCVECWVYSTALNIQPTGIFDFGLGSHGLTIKNGKLNASILTNKTNNTYSVFEHQTTMAINRWNHVCLERYNGYINTYTNGIKSINNINIGTTSLETKHSTNVTRFQIGSGNYLGTIFYGLNGYIDEVICIIGQSYRRSNFPVPTIALSI